MQILDTADAQMPRLSFHRSLDQAIDLANRAIALPIAVQLAVQIYRIRDQRNDRCGNQSDFLFDGKLVP